VVLDIGAGEGALARRLAERVDRVDAVDLSAAMVAVGRERPGGRRDNLRWIVGAAESAHLTGPYGLVTAGASVHWMDWPALMARLITAMADGAYLVVVEHGTPSIPWRAELIEVIKRHSRTPDYNPHYSVVDALSDQGHFAVAGRVETAPITFRQPIESYVEHFHSTASLAREHMAPDEVQQFDAAIRAAVEPWAVDGGLEMAVVATVAWGHPRRPPKAPNER
jgi:SAM-dependent methyltransferase